MVDTTAGPDGPQSPVPPGGAVSTVVGIPPGLSGYVQIRTGQGTVIVQQDVGSGDTSVWCYPAGYPQVGSASQVRWGGTLGELSGAGR